MIRRSGSRRTKLRDDGLGIVEVLVAMGLFGVVGTLLLGLAIATSQVTEDSRSLANVTEQARLAMERMTRELRQAEAILSVSLPTSPGGSTAITFWTDFNGNRTRDDNAADPEVMTYRWNQGTDELTLTANDESGNAVTQPVLAVDVSSFAVELRSSQWQYDKNADGTTTWLELDAYGAPVGNTNTMADAELEHIDLVDVSMTVATGSRAQTYSTQVDLRNQI